MNPKFGYKNRSNKASVAWESVYPVSSDDFEEYFKIDKNDIILSIIAFTTTILTWIAFKYYSRSFSYLYSFWDSSEYVIYSMISSGKTHGQDIISTTYNYGKYTDVLNPLPVQRLIYSIFRIITLGHYRLAQLLYTLFFSILSVLIFKRFLIAYNIAKSPLFTSILFCLFPLRFVLYRSLPTYDTLFLCLIFLCFILYRKGFHLCLIFFITISTFTRFEGFLLFIVFLILYALQKDISNIISMGAATFAIFLIINIKYPNYSRFIIPLSTIQGGSNSDHFEMKPFFYYCNLRRSISNLRVIHSLEMIYFPCIFGGFVLLFENLPLSVFCFVYTLFLSCIQSSDMHRFAIPVHIVSILVGLDFFLSIPSIKFALKCLMPFLFLGEMYYCGYQISTRQYLYNIVNYLKQLH